MKQLGFVEILKNDHFYPLEHYMELMKVSFSHSFLFFTQFHAVFYFVFNFTQFFIWKSIVHLISDICSNVQYVLKVKHVLHVLHIDCIKGHLKILLHIFCYKILFVIRRMNL